MVLTTMLNRTASWLSGSGPHSDVVISSRVRLARNLRNFYFMSRIESESQEELEATIAETLLDLNIVPASHYFRLHLTPEIDRWFLFERHLISREHVQAQGSRGVAISPDDQLSIMVNEEDHLRLQSLKPGFQVEEAYKMVSAVDSKLERALEFAFSEEFGYLTACPTNVGTGLRVSVMMHLPALAVTREINKVFQAVSRMNLAVRGLYGEGTEASGDFYQISNQNSLGKTEAGCLSSLERIIPKIVKYEQEAREALRKQDHLRLEDRVWRAYAMLRAARILSTNEALALLSALRMGVHMKIVESVDIAMINEIFLFSQRAHLQKKLNRNEMPTEERDSARAQYIRDRLRAAGNSH